MRLDMLRKDRKIKRLRMERDILTKSRDLVRHGERINPQKGYTFTTAHRADFPIRAMCRVLELSSSGYYDWLKRRPSARAIEDERLGAKIREIWVDSRKTYGHPRVHKALPAAGEQVGTRRVARLMHKEGIAGVTRRRGKSVAPGRDDKERPAPDLVDRDSWVDGPDARYLTDAESKGHSVFGATQYRRRRLSCSPRLLTP